MTITLSIHNRQGATLPGSLPLETLAKLVNAHIGRPDIPADFIKTEEGKTTLGVVYKLQPGETLDPDRLQQLLASSSLMRGACFLVRTVQMGSAAFAVVNMLLPQLALAWLANVFSSFVSNAWFMQITAGWDDRDNICQYPPRIVTLNPQPFIIMPVGMITAYYESNEEEYGTDRRGHIFAEQHTQLVGSVHEMVDVEFAERLAKSGFDGLVQMIDDRFTGLHHCCTVIVPDGRDVRVVHLRKNAHPVRYAVDDRDNELVVPWQFTGDRLFAPRGGIWPFPLGEPGWIDDVYMYVI